MNTRSQEALEEFDRRFKRADELEAKLKALVLEEQSQAAALQEARSRCAACKATLTAAEADSGTLDPGPEYEAAGFRIRDHHHELRAARCNLLHLRVEDSLGWIIPDPLQHLSAIGFKGLYKDFLESHSIRIVDDNS